jgi:uncharacterized protein YndB with AHSA1/START domain
VSSQPDLSPESRAIVRLVRRFDASPSRLFQAWIDGRKARAWIPLLVPDSELVRLDINARPGRGFKLVVRRGGEEVSHSGEYIEVTRARRLAFTWVIPGVSKETTLVNVELQPVWNGTELTLRHERVLPADAARAEETWGRVLDAITELLRV